MVCYGMLVFIRRPIRLRAVKVSADQCITQNNQ